MKHLIKITILGVLAIALCFAQQNTIVQTSLSAAITSNQTTFSVASATGINAPSLTNQTAGSILYIVDIGQTIGEATQVTSLSGTQVSVRRGFGAGSKAVAHASGAMVLVATIPSWFASTDPQGSCTTASTFVTPVVNIQNGRQWLCSSKTGTWVPGWGNNYAQPQVITATATASVGGSTAIAAPLLHISGTNAITGFTMGIGWQGQGFCVIPDAAFTTTTGGTTSGSTIAIAIASTAVANKTLCFTYDANASKFTASY